ncbi:MAG: YbaB/EbfC family nucleoid-associated protein [Rhodobiaceae bacterium]|nr:YbaB/EbfC family nucleoid-associated protein [Rhodobiaceae bacterium]MCC0055119.1 YbaB/EbfC family nucleoid-associated protein [Rhodobiaceae bacterium]
MDFLKMMKQAKELQTKLADAQAELDELVVDGDAGGGMVRATVSGKGELKSLSIDESLLKPEEKEIVEDLVLAAVNEARRKAEAAAAEKMQAMTSGLGLPPGMKLPGM